MAYTALEPVPESERELQRGSRFGAALEQPAIYLWLLAIILLVGGVLRFTGVDWDEGQHLHPDERYLTMVTDSLEWPDSLGQYLDSAENPLNPYNHGYGSYVYGLSPVIVAKALGEISGYTGYGEVYLAGRVMSGIMDLLCVVFVFLIGRRLYDARAGLLGAFFMALSVLSIQHSHFFTVDPSTTFYVTVALYFAVRVAQGEGWGSIVGLGIAFGLAVSAKISVLTFLGVIGLAFILRVIKAWRQEAHVDGAPLVQWRRRLSRLSLTFRVEASGESAAAREIDRLLLRALRGGIGVLGVVLVAFVVFRLVQPQAFTGPGFFDLQFAEQWSQDMDSIQRLVSGETDYPPSDQWAGRPAVWYALKNMVCWGLGLPLGIAVWASWALMAYEMLRGRWQHLLPWAWMTFTFFYQSVQFVKTVRYMLPIYPTMALMVGYGCVRLLDLARRRSASLRGTRLRRWPTVVATVLVVGVILGTAGWAVAFTSIYRQPVTRVTASRWVYENIPPGSSISFEYWDDPVPLNLDGHEAGREYRQVRMDPYWEDVPEKREALYDWLEQVDYIILSSNRLYGSIPRLPLRYPMTTRYYEALFSGELGFDELITFTSRPSLFGLEIIDDDADETFTVYDHPKVTILIKGDDYSLDKVQALFDGYDLDRVVRSSPVQADRAPNGLMLDEETWQEQQAGGTWSDIFDPDDLANEHPTLVWLLTLFLLGLVGFPLSFVVFHPLCDRGYVLAKTLGIVLLTILVWLAASLQVLPFTRGTILGALLAMMAVSGILAWVQRRALRDYIRERWRLLVVNEVFFLVFFAIFWLIRTANPDLWHPVVGGEKPMDLAYLNAVIKSTWFPPYDPWFAGGYINYYYLGYVMVGTLIKLTGIVPVVAYNLALPTLFALTAMGASSVVMNLLPSGHDESRWWPRGLRYGLLGACLVAVVGNLGQVDLLLGGLRDLGARAGVGTAAGSGATGFRGLAETMEGLSQVVLGGQSLPFRPEWWYWNASRIMGNGEINEFPFFSFLYGDLHAHVMALPVTILALGFCAAFIKSNGTVARARMAGRSLWEILVSAMRGLTPSLLLRLGLGAAVVGFLWGANTWDYPTYLGLSLVAIAIGVYRERQALDLEGLVGFVVRGALYVALGILLFWPYRANYGAAYSSVQPWEGATTTLGDYLQIHGLPLFVLASYLLVSVVGVSRRPTGAREASGVQTAGLLARIRGVAADLGWFALIVLGAIWVWALLDGAWVVVVALPLAVLALLLFMRPHIGPTDRFVAALIGTGFVLTMAVEYVVLKGDIGRMNTVFKFYLQVWVLWGIASAVGLAHLWETRRAWRAGWQVAWQAILALLLVAVSLYPITASYGKITDRWTAEGDTGLDGSAYMATAQYQDAGQTLNLAYDQRAIDWLLENVAGSPVIAEANTPLYRWGGRVSVYTGLPSIVGWDWHQRQQRAAYSGQVVDWRLQDLRLLYDATDVATAREILDRYRVGFVYVGELERAYYSEAGLAKFESMVGQDLESVYSDGPVAIYRVNGVGELVPADGGAAHRSLEGVLAWIRDLLPGAPVLAEEPLAGTDQVGGLPTELPEPVSHLPVVDGRGWNGLANGSTIGAIVTWWLVLQVIGLAAWPLLARVAPSLADAGYGLSKSVGLLLVGYVVWFGSSLRVLQNRPGVIWATVLVLAVCSVIAWRHSRSAIHSAWREHKRLLLLEEALFTLSFLAFVGLRLANPDLWQPWFGGEKSMELAFLNATVKSAYMPPYDPYFAGYSINYYYYGYFLVNVVLKLTGLRPEVGFNLAVPALFAMVVSHTFLVGYHLARKRLAVWGGLTAALLVAVAGNLSTLQQLIQGLARAGGAVFAERLAWADLAHVGPGLVSVLRGDAAVPALEYWYGGTRIIPYTINEFPYFSYLFADLHPHMMAIPIGLAVLAMVWLWVSDPSPSPAVVAQRWVITAILLGALGPSNTWDLPAIVLVLVCAAVHAGWRRGGSRGVAHGLLGAVSVLGAAILLYAPFYAHFAPPGDGLGLVLGQTRSPMNAFLTVWGAHLFLLASFVAMSVQGSARGDGSPDSRRRRGVLAAVGLCAVALVTGLFSWRGEWVLCLLVLALAGLIAAAVRMRGPTAFLRCLLIGTGLLVLLGVELVYLTDFMAGGDWYRMNTVFKFYEQAWVFLGLALGSALPDIWRWIGERAVIPASAWYVVAVVVLGGSLSYAVWATPQRIAQRFPSGSPAGGTLDGSAYMTSGVYYWPDESHAVVLSSDLEAIAWLWETVRGTPVVVEAELGYYREGGMRVSSYTGLPTIVGMHSGEQHAAEVVAARRQDVARIYDTTSTQELLSLVSRYQVEYIYVGQLERLVYPESGLAKFDTLAAQGVLQVAYENARTRIYRVIEGVA